MAKFYIDCPHCNTLNKASTFIFAKKKIECGNCGREIDVKSNRLTTRECPHCNNHFLYDKAKHVNKCPACHEAIDMDEGKLASFGCPQCGCNLQVDEKDTFAICPVCDYKVTDVAKEIVKSKLVTDGEISVIAYEGDNSTFVWKHPVEDFMYGSQLIVHESQEAIFFLNGEALDCFGPGRYTLKTENTPELTKVYNLPDDVKSPFHAEVYFINHAVQMGFKWGTDSRVRFIEPKTGLPLDIGASGELFLQACDSRRLVVKLVGTTGGLSRNDILSADAGASSNWQGSVKNFFSPLIRGTIKANIGAIIKDNSINILEIDSHLELLSEGLRKKVSEEFEAYGLKVPSLYVTNVSLPEDNPDFKRLRRLISEAYLGVQEANLEGSIDLTKAKNQLELEKIKADIERQRAQAQADAVLMRGTAEAQVMSAKGYSQRDVLNAEVQKTYAEGIGRAAANGNTVAQNIANVAANNLVDASFTQLANETQKIEQTASNGWDCSCGQKGNTGKFCMECGSPKPEAWDCACGAIGNMGKFCSECGARKPENWNCSCGAKGNTGKFCSECGKKREDM